MSIECRFPTCGDESALRALWTQAFGDSEAFLDLFFDKVYAPNRCRVALENGSLVGALYWFDCQLQGRRIAYLYAIATESTHRNRGICGKLMEDTHRLLAEQGYAGAILVPGEPELFRFYEKQGYRTVSTIRKFTARAGTPIPVRELSAGEYARLRRTYLPENGIIQEGENLTFLGSLARFYAGDGFLAAVSGVGEWLGDESLAPGVVAVLGLEKAIFRTPGEGVPFAMARWFGRDFCPESIYFGFAFD